MIHECSMSNSYWYNLSDQSCLFMHNAADTETFVFTWCCVYRIKVGKNTFPCHDVFTVKRSYLGDMLLLQQLHALLQPSLLHHIHNKLKVYSNFSYFSCCDFTSLHCKAHLYPPTCTLLLLHDQLTTNAVESKSVWNSCAIIIVSTPGS